MPLYLQPKTAYTNKSLTITLRLQNRFVTKCGKDCSISKRKETQRGQRKSNAEWMSNSKLPTIPSDKKIKFSTTMVLLLSVRSSLLTREEMLKQK